jgi:hypothetical protein
MLGTAIKIEIGRCISQIFCHCDKTPEINSFRDERFIFAMVTEPHYCRPIVRQNITVERAGRGQLPTS